MYSIFNYYLTLAPFLSPPPSRVVEKVVAEGQTVGKGAAEASGGRAADLSPTPFPHFPLLLLSLVPALPPVDTRSHAALCLRARSVSNGYLKWTPAISSDVFT